MEKEDLPSDSDQSDEDYVPEGTTDLPSEEESEGDEEPEETNESRKRTKKPAKKSAKKIHVEEEKSTESKELNEEQRKKHEEDIWASFLTDTGTKPKSVTCTPSTKTNSIETKVPEKPKPATTTVTKIFEFAGEQVKVTKEVSSDSVEARLQASPSSSSTNDVVPPARGRGRAGGLSAVLGQLGKKNKISTLEKSKLDWEGFKQTEGLNEEIETFNKGKNGYLERQDFLQRTDLRQFEIEKQLRTTSRRK